MQLGGTYLHHRIVPLNVDSQLWVVILDVVSIAVGCQDAGCAQLSSDRVHGENLLRDLKGHDFTFVD